MLPLFLTLLQVGQTLLAVPVEHVLTSRFQQPPANGAWVGDAPHRFMDGQVTLFCGSHGVFSGGGEPPRKSGETSLIEYSAVFQGELVLHPPLVSAPQTTTIDEPIRMTERLTAQDARDGLRRFSTELVAIEFSGTSFPDRVRVRESAARRSTGSASFDRNTEGQFEVQGSYQVWLEVSVDAGRSWHPAENAVSMQLKPGVRTATLAVEEPVE